MNAPVTLGIVTAGPVGAALIAGENEFGASTGAQALDGVLRCVKEALRRADVDIAAVERIAVCTGPGSFTGLRIGVAFAKSLAQARHIPIVGVSSYDIAAWSAGGSAAPHAAAVEGKRGFYYARLRCSADGPAEFCAGGRAAIDRFAGRAAVCWLSSLTADEQALRVARIGRDADSASADWSHVIIDYGQRPNAVINWEAARREAEGGVAPAASNETRA